MLPRNFLDPGILSRVDAHVIPLMNDGSPISILEDYLDYTRFNRDSLWSVVYSFIDQDICRNTVMPVFGGSYQNKWFIFIKPYAVLPNTTMVLTIGKITASANYFRLRMFPMETCEECWSIMRSDQYEPQSWQGDIFIWNDCPIDWLTVTNWAGEPNLNISYI